MQDAQGWTAGPQTRGTFDILWACLSTLALCIWTAVHPNILLIESYSRNLLHRLGMMVLAIVFPEIIISAAWKQLRDARALCSQIKQLKSNMDCHFEQPHERSPRLNSMTPDLSGHVSTTSEAQASQIGLLPVLDIESTTRETVSENHTGPASTTSSSQVVPHRSETLQSLSVGRIPHWTTEQALFAIMGGFAVEVKYRDEHHEQCAIRRLITADGIAILAKVGLPPDVTPEDIEERSNADTIAKMFVLSQVIWFALQVLGRLIEGLHITPLEAHTTVHVGCMIIVYVIWFKKPYNLTRSILLENDDVKQMAALFNFIDLIRSLHKQKYLEYEARRTNYWKDRVVRASNNLLDHDPPPNPPIIEPLTVLLNRYSSDELRAFSTRTGQEHVLTALAPSALEGFQRLKSHGCSDLESFDSQRWNFLRKSSENFIVRAVWGGWSTNTGHEMSLDKGIHFLFNVLYGAGHLAAWASPSFPTLTEQFLWRVSAIMLCSVPIWGCLWILWWKAVGSNRKELYLFRNGDFDIIAAPLFFTVMLAYTLARCCFLIESVISLRMLPKAAYEAVEWSSVLPHVA